MKPTASTNAAPTTANRRLDGGWRLLCITPYANSEVGVRFPNFLRPLWLPVLLVFLVSSVSAQVTFSDNEFQVEDWELTVLAAPSGGDSTAAHEDLGGCTGAFRVVTTSVNPAPSGTRSGVVGFHRNVNANYNPGVLGPIGTISYSECARIFSGGFGDGQGTGPAIRQGGNIYVYFMVTGSSTSWHPVSVGGIVESNFIKVVENNTDSMFDSSSHPDFSQNGDPIEFGFWRGNGTCYGCSGYAIQGGIDKWKIDIFPPFEIESFSALELCLNTDSIHEYVVQYSTNLAANSWIDYEIFTNTPCNALQLIGPDTIKFFRVVRRSEQR